MTTDGELGISNEWLFNYDNNGRRTSTIYNYNNQGVSYSMKYDRTYNTDGTVQKITHPYSFNDSRTVTQTYTWENGKTTMNYDDYASY